MTLTMTIHLWFRRIRALVRSWFDFRVDLAGLGFDEEEINVDLATGRD